MNPFAYLVNTLFDLYIMVVLLRLWLQWARADFYNPFSQFIVKITQPILAPMRKTIPSVGGIDLATLLLAYLLVLVKFILLQGIFTDGGSFFSPDYLWISALALLKSAGSLVFWILLIRALLSWISQGRSPIEYVMYQLTEPMCAPVRRILPDMGGLDLSVLVIFIGLQFANYLMGYLVGMIWYSL